MKKTDAKGNELVSSYFYFCTHTTQTASYVNVPSAVYIKYGTLDINMNYSFMYLL